MGKFSTTFDRITTFFTQSDEQKRVPRQGKRDLSGSVFSLGSRLVGGIDGARVDRFGASWAATPTTPDQLISCYWRILVSRSRDLVVNDPYLAYYVRLCRANIVGHGPRLRCTVKNTDGSQDKKINSAVSFSWETWCDDPNECDVTGQQSFLALTLSVVHSWVVDGEAFIKIIEGGEFGVQLQLIDAVRCPPDYNVETFGNGNFIRSGIEFNSYGRPVAYHFLSDPNHGDYYAANAIPYIRVPAEQICHVFRKTSADQRRGLPWATPSLYRLKNLKEFEDNATLNARVGAGKMGIITWQDGSGPEYPDDAPPIHFSAEGGTFAELPPGADLREFNPAFPDNSYGSFIKSGLRAVSSGLGVSYTSLGNDLEGVNYSSIRAGILNERELYKEDQIILIEQFIKPVFKYWIKAALLRSQVVSETGERVIASKLGAIVRAVKFTPRRWDWVDPKSDAAANQKAMSSGLKSPQEIIRERGRDPVEVAEELGDWWTLCAEKGVPHEALQAGWGEQVKAAINDDEEEGKSNDKQ